MRISMLYNRSAGDQVRLDRIRGVMARHGHELVCVIEAQAEVERLLEASPDVVVAAGGDGTVGVAARRLAHSGIPLAILPLGTANNIATSLGTSEHIDDVIAGWEQGRRVTLDLGVADGIWGRRLFVEGVGGGLIATAIVDAQRRPDRDGVPPRSKVARAIWTMSHVLDRLQPLPCTVVADGARTTGEFLLVEVLNIGSIGPTLLLSANADPSDGLFRVVVAGEEHREELARYLRDLLDGRDHPPPLISQRARHVALEGVTEVHVDDEVLSTDRQQVSMHVDIAALEVLT